MLCSRSSPAAQHPLFLLTSFVHNSTVIALIGYPADKRFFYTKYDVPAKINASPLTRTSPKGGFRDVNS